MSRQARVHSRKATVRVALAVVATALGCAAAQNSTPLPCTLVGKPQFLGAAPEASGIVSAGGALWTLNDSSAPVLFRLDASGQTTAVTVAGAEVRDWEDIAAGACDAGTCLYIADIGDNKGSRDRITIYEVQVPPSGSTSTKAAGAFHFTYPDNPHDAEAFLMIGGMVFIITKENPARIYQGVTSYKARDISTLKLLRTLDEKIRITGAAVSRDRRWIALRSNSTLLVYAADDFMKGGNPTRVDLRPFKEPQGEGVEFGSGGDLFLVSEGGGKDTAGMLTRVHCAFIR